MFVGILNDACACELERSELVYLGISNDVCACGKARPSVGMSNPIRSTERSVYNNINRAGYCQRLYLHSCVDRAILLLLLMLS